MTKLSELNLLIIDPFDLDGSELRKMFIDICAGTHVVESYPKAAVLIENTKVDVVLLPFQPTVESIVFCRLLSQKEIPFIFTSQPPPRYSARRTLSEEIAAVQNVLVQQLKASPNRIPRH